MSAKPDHTQFTRQVVLRSGRTVDVVYFEEPEIEQTSTGLLRETDLHVCRQCESQLVYPTDWEELDEESWRVRLRCPNCEWAGVGVHRQEVVEVFDEELDRGTAELVADLRTLSRANMEDDVARFVQALDAGHILPCDF